ncbi:hypothetical protein [Candidatus Sororendozoicomonas aggregata]|uniref:hypothetical protein n=1 Tax=Candidatus Sororendozoicomonas aggregata TaxID=3073239 RepID=UPI002ED0DFD0
MPVKGTESHRSSPSVLPNASPSSRPAKHRLRTITTTKIQPFLSTARSRVSTSVNTPLFARAIKVHDSVFFSPDAVAKRLDDFFDLPQEDTPPDFQEALLQKAFEAAQKAGLDDWQLDLSQPLKTPLPPEIRPSCQAYCEELIKQCRNDSSIEHILHQLDRYGNLFFHDEKNTIRAVASKEEEKLLLRNLRNSRGIKRHVETAPHIKLRKALDPTIDYSQWTYARKMKVTAQKDIARAEKSILNRHHWKHAAASFNDSSLPLKERESAFLKGIEAINHLRKHELIGREYWYQKNSLSPFRYPKKCDVMVMDEYIKNAVQPMLYDYCKNVIYHCYDKESLNHIEQIIEKLAHEKKLPLQTATHLKTKIEIQRHERTILDYNGKLISVTKNWKQLPKLRKIKIKSDLKKAISEYKESFKKTKDTKKIAEKYEANIKKLLLEEFEKTVNDQYRARKTDKSLISAFTKDYKKLQNKSLEELLKLSEDDPDNYHKVTFTTLKKVKDRINHASNRLYEQDRGYQQAMSLRTVKEFEVRHGTQFKTNNTQALFRGVSEGPEIIFKSGFKPRLLSQVGYQQGLLNEAYVNAYNTEHDPKKHGWTGGVVSTSDHFLHSASGTYTATTGLGEQPESKEKPARWIYLTVPAITADLSQHLTQQNPAPHDETFTEAWEMARDAREVITPLVTADQVIAGRPVYSDGTFGNTVWNPEASAKNPELFKKGHVFNNGDIQAFLNSQSVGQLEANNPDRKNLNDDDLVNLYEAQKQQRLLQKHQAEQAIRESQGEATYAAKQEVEKKHTAGLSRYKEALAEDVKRRAGNQASWQDSLIDIEPEDNSLQSKKPDK